MLSRLILSVSFIVFQFHFCPLLGYSPNSVAEEGAVVLSLVTVVCLGHVLVVPDARHEVVLAPVVSVRINWGALKLYWCSLLNLTLQILIHCVYWLHVIVKRHQRLVLRLSQHVGHLSGLLATQRIGSDRGWLGTSLKETYWGETQTYKWFYFLCCFGRQWQIGVFSFALA